MKEVIVFLEALEPETFIEQPLAAPRGALPSRKDPRPLARLPLGCIGVLHLIAASPKLCVLLMLRYKVLQPATQPLRAAGERQPLISLRA